MIAIFATNAYDLNGNEKLESQSPKRTPVKRRAKTLRCVDNDLRPRPEVVRTRERRSIHGGRGIDINSPLTPRYTACYFRRGLVPSKWLLTNITRDLHYDGIEEASGDVVRGSGLDIFYAA